MHCITLWYMTQQHPILEPVVVPLISQLMFRFSVYIQKQSAEEKKKNDISNECQGTFWSLLNQLLLILKTIQCAVLVVLISVFRGCKHGFVDCSSGEVWREDR